ncbi:MAG: flagellar biosynthetic protein FlhB [Oligoflexia bacterium]|nr:MAG: flagellar biosynthetic protein FlhB [Oligoflexia bacterium]
MADDQGERSEEATQTRREDFRKRGQVAQTRELASTLFLLAGLGAIFALSKFFFQELNQVFQYSMGPDLVAHIRSGDILPAVKFAGEKIFILVAPVLLIAFIISIGSSILQVGWLQVEDALTMKFEKIDPISGFKRIFSLRTLMEGVKAFLKLCLIIGIVYLVLKGEAIRMMYMIQFDTSQIVSYLGSITAKLLGGVGVAMAALAAADYFFQRWDLEKQMMMTKQEIKEEHKSREGDPLIKSRIRRVQREMANKRMMEKVPQADVIITNPTHIAVALKYDANLPAPQLIAKGADLIAEKIKALAKENNIPVIENKPLARTIYKTMKLGQVIPRELFVAVAEVLSYVYRLKKKVKR